MKVKQLTAAAVLLSSVVAGGVPAPVSGWEPPPPPPPPPPSKVFAAFRLAGLRAGGSIVGMGNDPHLPTKMTDVIAYGASIGGDAALRIGRGFAAGVYADLGLPAGRGDRGRTGLMARAGLEALWERRSEGPARWWASLGAGYEWLSAVDYYYLTGTLSGFELCNVKVGADLRAGRRFTLGPYFGASVGRYRWVEGDVATVLSITGYPVDGEIDDQGAHYWFSLGLRGTFDL